MVKSQFQKQQSKKTCFGTKEWSKNSGICNRCDWKDECGEIQAKKNNS
ncbi:MAG: hypothetical protein ABH811_02875 [archaeon]